MDRAVYCRGGRGREGGIVRGSASNSTMWCGGVVRHFSVRNRIPDLLVCVDRLARTSISLWAQSISSAQVLPYPATMLNIIRFTVKALH